MELCTCFGGGLRNLTSWDVIWYGTTIIVIIKLGLNTDAYLLMILTQAGFQMLDNWLSRVSGNFFFRYIKLLTGGLLDFFDITF